MTGPHRGGHAAQAWHLLAIFVATIVGIVTQPLPLGAVAMLGLGAAQLTKVLTFSQAFSAFSSEIPCAPWVQGVLRGNHASPPCTCAGSAPSGGWKASIGACATGG